MKKYIFKYRYNAGPIRDKHWSNKTVEFEAQDDESAKSHVKKLWNQIREKFKSDSDAQKHHDIYQYISLEEIQIRPINVGLVEIR
jgi:hypothetical protein